MHNIIYLNETQKATWAEAGTNFKGKELYQIIQRTLTNLPSGQQTNDFYEIRRYEVPHAFDALLKLQSTGLAKRHIEADKNRGECREILQIEVTLLDLIMQAIEMLLDIFLRVLGGVINGYLSRSTEPPVMATIPQKYVPSWEKQPRIEYQDGYTR